MESRLAWKWCKFPLVIEMYTELAHFARLWFPHYTAFATKLCNLTIFEVVFSAFQLLLKIYLGSYLAKLVAHFLAVLFTTQSKVISIFYNRIPWIHTVQSFHIDDKRNRQIFDIFTCSNVTSVLTNNHIAVVSTTLKLYWYFLVFLVNGFKPH